ncbi:hypothetical protein CER19_23935 [Pseudomonas sp. GL93]|nr:hypothetical protein CER19_23935 [Pseudomonas sp. GL93]
MDFMKNYIAGFFIRPVYIGAFFLCLMPIFATLYFFIGGSEFNNNPSDFWTFLYFSIVTITTLGFGDIYPVTLLTKLLVAFEVIMGALCAGLFLNACSYTISERSAQAERTKQNFEEKLKHFKTSQALMLNQDSIVSYHLKLYVLRVWTVCTPITGRVDYSFDSMLGLNGAEKFKFSFNDIRDLHKPSLLRKDSFQTSAVVAYFKELHLLISAIKDMMNFAPMREWPSLQTACLEFIYTSNSLDCSEIIIKGESTTAGDVTLGAFAAEIISESTEDPKLENTGNIVDPYINLYFLLKYSLDFCAHYRTEIDKIVNDTGPTE